MDLVFRSAYVRADHPKGKGRGKRTEGLQPTNDATCILRTNTGSLHILIKGSVDGVAAANVLARYAADMREKIDAVQEIRAART